MNEPQEKVIWCFDVVQMGLTFAHAETYPYPIGRHLKEAWSNFIGGQKREATRGPRQPQTPRIAAESSPKIQPCLLTPCLPSLYRVRESTETILVAFPLVPNSRSAS
jgi:hypothetical protein